MSRHREKQVREVRIESSVARLLNRILRARNVGLLSLASLIAALVSFLVNIVTARVLGPDGRGAVALVLQIAYISAPLAVFGFPRAKLRAGVGGRELPGGGRFSMILSLLFVAPVIGWAYGGWFLLALPAAAVTASFQVLRSNAIVEGTYRRYFLMFVGYQGSILAGTGLFAYLEVEAWQPWAMVYIMPSVLVLLVSFGGFRWELNPLIWIRANWPYAGADFSSIVILRADRLALGYFSGSAVLGLYVVVATALEPIYWVAQSVADSRTVKVYREARLKVLAVKLLRETVWFSVAGVAGGAAIWYALVPVFGEEYESARILVVPLMVASVCLVLYRQAAGIALIRGRTTKLGVSEAALSVAAVAIYVVMASSFGALGAAWASCLVYILGFGVLIWVSLGPNDPTERMDRVEPMARI